MSSLSVPSAEDLHSYFVACKSSAELLLLSQPGLNFSELSKPDVGNPYGYDVVSDEGERFFISPGSEYHYCYSQIIVNLPRESASWVVLELGGGFGGMAYYLIRDSKFKYLGLELAENVALRSFYLMSLFPQKNFYL
jgi:hypothetical protein